VAHQSNHSGGSEGESQALKRGDCIAAVATPPGRGGIGVVRISGDAARSILSGIAGPPPTPRVATLADFRAADDSVIDRGLVVYFPGPHSYTGEDVVELHGHGGPVVMRLLLGRCLELGARIARPGEFTERAYLNDRIDLAQAESVADLIDAASEEAARGAARSLTGEFSSRVHALMEQLTDLRVHVEASIDFPEEEIDPADWQLQQSRLDSIRIALQELFDAARQGVVLREGLEVVLVGRPNVGKSSLLNRLAGDDVAIVSPVPGTTRDYVRATLVVEGVPIHLIDTAGLRDTDDEVERIGVDRTWKAATSAGAAIFIQDASHPDDADLMLRSRLGSMPCLVVRNKIDLVGEIPGFVAGSIPVASLSAKTGEGVDLLRDWLLRVAGWKPQSEGGFLARARHMEALEDARQCLERASTTQAIEIKAEELSLAQMALGKITGTVSADELLGEIFGRFCIGK
jgi:tRNA modification GTPase